MRRLGPQWNSISSASGFGPSNLQLARWCRAWDLIPAPEDCAESASHSCSDHGGNRSGSVNMSTSSVSSTAITAAWVSSRQLSQVVFVPRGTAETSHRR